MESVVAPVVAVVAEKKIKIIKPNTKLKLVLAKEVKKSTFPTVEELANCYVTDTAKSLDCKLLVAIANQTQYYCRSSCTLNSCGADCSSAHRKYRYISGEREIMIKINGMMHHTTAITFATGWRNLAAVYRDEIHYNDDRDALHFKHYFNIFKMKKQLKGEKTKEGIEKKSNAGCKITRVKYNEDGSVSIALPSTHGKNDLLNFMTNNGMAFGDVEYRMKSYEQRVTWIIKGKWDEVDSPEYKSYEARMLKEIKAKEAKEAKAKTTKA